MAQFGTRVPQPKTLELLAKLSDRDALAAMRRANSRAQPPMRRVAVKGLAARLTAPQSQYRRVISFRRSSSGRTLAFVMRGVSIPLDKFKTRRVGYRGKGATFQARRLVIEVVRGRPKTVRKGIFQGRIRNTGKWATFARKSNSTWRKDARAELPVRRLVSVSAARHVANMPKLKRAIAFAGFKRIEAEFASEVDKRFRRVVTRNKG